MIEYIGILCFFLSGIMVGMALKECGEEINQLLKDKKALEAEKDSKDWKIPETEVIVELIIYGFDSNEEQAAIEEIKNQIETGLDIQGISGTRLVSVTTSTSGTSSRGFAP